MPRRTILRGSLLAAALLVSASMLDFYRSSDAAPPTSRQPFANSVEQRAEMIGQLKAVTAALRDVQAQLKAQNALLESGRVKVVIANDKKT